jgi:hypothetical protein
MIFSDWSSFQTIQTLGYIGTLIMAKRNNNKIVLFEKAGHYDEFKLGDTLTVYPGNVLAYQADTTVRPATAADANVFVAIENSLAGQWFQDPYTEGQVIRAFRPVSGDRILIRSVPAAYAFASYVKLDANGTVSANANATGAYAQVIEDLTTTADEPLLGVQII